MKSLDAKLVKKMKPEVLAALKGMQFKPQPKVWVVEEKVLTIPSEMYEIESTKVEKGDWTAHVAMFAVGDDVIKLRYRNGELPDADNDISVCRFKAAVDFTPTNGKPIAKGTITYFVINE